MIFYDAFKNELLKISAETYVTSHPKHGRIFYAEPPADAPSKKSSPPPKVSKKYAKESPFTIRREVPIKGIRAGKTATAAAFRDELLKIAEEEGLIGAQEADPGPDAVQTEQDGGVEQPAATDTPEMRPDESSAGDSVGDLATMDARRSLQGMLKTEEGKRSIRETFNQLDRKAQEVATLKNAFTRGLLRARREVFGPVHDPVQHLNEVLSGNAFQPQPT